MLSVAGFTGRRLAGGLLVHVDRNTEGVSTCDSRT